MKKIEFKKIKIKNFLSVGDVPVEIFPKRGLNIITGENLDVVGRQNGIGKSTIADGFYFALFGETIRDIKSKSIINKFTNKTCECVVEFDVEENGNKDSYKIVRTLKPSKLFLFKNEEDVTQSTIAETDETISKILNASKEVFQNSVIMSVNGTTPFMATKKVEKRKFVEGILDISMFSEMLKNVRNEYNELSKDHEIDKANLETSKVSLNIFQEQKEDTENRLKNEIEELESDIKNKSSEIGNLENEIKDLQSKKLDNIELNKEKKDLTEKLLKLSEKRNQISQENSKLVAALEKIEENEKEKKELSETLNTLNDDLKKETKNFKEVLKEDFDEQIKEAENSKKSCLEDRNKLQERLEEVKGLKEDNGISLKENERELSRLKENKGTCEYCKKSIDDILRPINEKKIQELELYKQKLIEEKEKLDGAQKKISEKIEKISDKSCELISTIDDLKLKKLEKQTIEASNNLVERKIESIKNEISKIQEKINKMKDFSDRLPKILEVIEENKKIILEDAERESEMAKLLKRVEENLTNNRIVENNIDNFKRNLFILNETKKELESKLKTKNESKISELEKIQEKVDDLLQKINVVSERYERNEILLEVMTNAKFILSEEGVKSYIVKKILNILNSKISYYLAKMDAPCRISFDEYFEDSIVDLKGRESEYWNFSGAERKAIDLAIMFAFIDLMRLNGNASFNTLFFDELLDSSMDSKGIENVINILNDRVETYGDCIYIISHRKESIKHMTGELIFLQKKNGITSLKNL
jgi:DNA repair exonuclease SbcCD ATPase subunit